MKATARSISTSLASRFAGIRVTTLADGRIEVMADTAAKAVIAERHIRERLPATHIIAPRTEHVFLVVPKSTQT